MTSWEQLWLPLYPLASDDLQTGIYRMARGPALARRYVEANPHALSNLLVVDVDHGDGELRALSAPAKPTAIVANPANGHVHAVWALQEPVTTTEYGSRKATAYAAAVVEGLRRSVGGDPAYSGLMTKNPKHEAWQPLWLAADQADLWSLDRLNNALDEFMPPPRWRRRRDPVGLGRNCSIFETARTWAYREIRNHWGDPAGLDAALQAHVHALNAEFSEPLPNSEAAGIARSIHRWIITKSRMWADGAAVYEATFTTIQAARARRPRKYTPTLIEELTKEGSA